MSTSTAPLDGVLPGRTHMPGTAGFDAARDGFDLSAIPAPDVAVSATDEADVAAAVRFTAGRGPPVAVRATGHGPVPRADQGLLIDTGHRRSYSAKLTITFAISAPLGIDVSIARSNTTNSHPWRWAVSMRLAKSRSDRFRRSNLLTTETAASPLASLFRAQAMPGRERLRVLTPPSLMN